MDGRLQRKRLQEKLWFLFVFVGLVSYSQGIEAASRPTTSSLKVLHTPPTWLRPGNPYTLRCRVPENDDLEEVYLRYRRKGEKSYRSVRMTLYGGDQYKATLKGFQIRKPALEYYLVALDLDKKWLLLFASAEKPHSISVTFKPPADQPPTPPRRAAPTPAEPLPPQEDAGTVITAGRKEQRIQNAPGVITVITAADIERGGWRSLAELLRYSVGIDINNNHHSPDIGIRGLNPLLAYGDKLIILVDGHNMVWRQFNRNLLNLSWVSIDNIKRIEIIRGPGSALWGANALSGVINIITKSSQDLKGFQSIGGGSPLSRSYFLTLQGGQELWNGLTFRGSFSLHQENTSPLLAPVYEFKRSSNIDYVPSGQGAFSQSFYGQLTWRGFNLRFHQSRYAPRALFAGSNFISDESAFGTQETLLSTDRYILHLSWSTLLGSWGTFTLWSSFDTYGYNRDAQLEINPLSPYTSSSRLKGNGQSFAIKNTNTGAIEAYYPRCSELSPRSTRTDKGGPCVELTEERGQTVCALYDNPIDKRKKESFLYKKRCFQSADRGRYTLQQKAQDYRLEAGILFSAYLLDSLSISTGLEMEYLNMLGFYLPAFLAPGAEAPRFTNLRISGYLQLQYNLARFVEFTAGVRLDYDQQFNFVATPRAAIVLTPGLGFYGKLLYGRAFKAPSFQDLYAFLDDNAAFFGNPGLKPEEVDTLELQLGWARQKLLAFSVNGYVSFFRNLIIPVRREWQDGLLNEDQLLEKLGRSDQSINRTVEVSYFQKVNEEELTTVGGALELRLFPVRGLNIVANFGVFKDLKESLQYTSPYKGSLSFYYHLPIGSLGLVFAAGALVAAPKAVPNTPLNLPGALLPASDVASGQETPVPSWSADKNPRPPEGTPLLIQSYLSLQLLNILKSLDLGLRLTNLANLEQYDASDLLLYPQKKLELMLWLRARL